MSFTLDTKKELCADKRKMPDCCRKALLHGLLLGAREYGERIFFSSECESVTNLMYSLVKAEYKASPELGRESIAGHKMTTFECKGELAELIHSDFDLFSEPYRLNEEIIYCCGKCSSYFLRGLFLSRGHISEPEKEGRLEISIQGKALADDISGLLTMMSLPSGICERRGRYVLLYKNAKSMERFLAFIGADKAVMNFINEKGMKELRADTNRIANLETSTMNKAISAALKQTSIVKKLEKKNMLGVLPTELRETAKLRLLYPNVSLAELAAKHEPPITKSGVVHRLKKIEEFDK